MTNFESSRRGPSTGLAGALRRPRSDAAPLLDLAVVAGGDGDFNSRIFFQGRAAGPQCTDDIETRVRKLVAARLGMEEYDIQLDSDFRNDLGAEPLEVVELVMALEAKFGIEIADDDAERIETVHQTIDYLEETAST